MVVNAAAGSSLMKAADRARALHRKILAAAYEYRGKQLLDLFRKADEVNKISFK
jgi:hypothetical protein